MGRVPRPPRAANIGPTDAPDGGHLVPTTAVAVGAEVTGGAAGAGVGRLRLGRDTNAKNTPVAPRPKEAMGGQGVPGAVLEAAPGTGATAALPGVDHAAAFLRVLLLVKVAKVATAATGVAGAALVAPSQPTAPTESAAVRVPALTVIPGPSEVAIGSAARQAARRLEVRVRPRR